MIRLRSLGPFLIVPVTYFLVWFWAGMTLLAFEDKCGDRLTASADACSPAGMTGTQKTAAFLWDYVVDFPLGIPFWFQEDSPDWRLLLWLPTSLTVASLFCFLRRTRRGRANRAESP